MNKFFILVILSISSLFQLQAEGCRIDFSIKGINNDSIFFASRYGNKELVLDTVKLDNKGEGFYVSKKRLKPGIYLIVFPNKKYVEILINQEQYFSFITDTSNLFKNIIIEGAEETSLYQQYQLKSLHIKELTDSLKNATAEVQQILSYRISNKKKELLEFRKNIETKIQGSFISALFRLMDEPVIPDTKAMGKELFTQKYYYTVNHYFDNMDWNDERLLRTYLFHEKIDFYFNKLIVQHADTIIPCIDQTLKKASGNMLAYRYLLNFLLSNYRSSKATDADKVFVYIADNYYLNNKATWADEKFLKLLAERADKLRTTVKGNIAPDLVMETPEGKSITLHTTQAAFTILFFWKPDCEVCKTEITKLLNLFHQYKNNSVKVFAVYVHADRVIWDKAINELQLDWINGYDPLLKSNFMQLYKVQTTPQMFLLDKDKRIIAKGIKVEQMSKLLMERMKK